MAGDFVAICHFFGAFFRWGTGAKGSPYPMAVRLWNLGA